MMGAFSQISNRTPGIPFSPDPEPGDPIKGGGVKVFQERDDLITSGHSLCLSSAEIQSLP